MKRLIFLTMALSAMIAVSCSRNAGTGAASYAAAPRVWISGSNTLDTLNNAETITQTIGAFLSPIYYEVQVAADSISGSTAATATLQHSLDAGTNWVSLGTVTINGTSTRQKLTGNVLGGNMRLQTVSSGTQVTTLTTAYIVAGKPD